MKSSKTIGRLTVTTIAICCGASTALSMTRTTTRMLPQLQRLTVRLAVAAERRPGKTAGARVTAWVANATWSRTTGKGAGSLCFFNLSYGIFFLCFFYLAFVMLITRAALPLFLFLLGMSLSRPLAAAGAKPSRRWRPKTPLPRNGQLRYHQGNIKKTASRTTSTDVHYLAALLVLTLISPLSLSHAHTRTKPAFALRASLIFLRSPW